MSTIKTGQSVFDKHNQKMKVVGFDKDYAGRVMVVTNREATAKDVTPLTQKLLAFLGISRNVGDTIKRAYYPEQLSK